MKYFVSGHLDISSTEFEEHYVPALTKAIEEGAEFVVGDARGTDSMTQAFLEEKGAKMTVFHMFKKPRNAVKSAERRGKFQSDRERDEAMTRASDADIAWVRSEEASRNLYGSKYKAGRKSGTQKNIERRIRFSSE